MHSVQYVESLQVSIPNRIFDIKMHTSHFSSTYLHMYIHNALELQTMETTMTRFKIGVIHGLHLFQLNPEVQTQWGVKVHNLIQGLQISYDRMSDIHMPVTVTDQNCSNKYFETVK